MLEIRIGQNMNFGGLGGGDAEEQAAPDCPKEGEEGTHGSSAAKVVMGGGLAVLCRALWRKPPNRHVEIIRNFHLPSRRPPTILSTSQLRSFVSFAAWILT